MSTLSLPAVPGPTPSQRSRSNGATPQTSGRCRRCDCPGGPFLTLRTPQFDVPVCQMCAIVLVGGFADRVVVELVIPASDLGLAS